MMHLLKRRYTQSARGDLDVVSRVSRLLEESESEHTNVSSESANEPRETTNRGRFERAVETSKSIAGEAGSKVRATAARTGSSLWANARSFGSRVGFENEREILANNKVLKSFASGQVRPSFHTTGLVAVTMAARGAVELGAGATLLHHETPLIRATRSVMDTDSGFVQRLWRAASGSDASSHAINTWMDRVPGASTAGGFAHRINHGHDLDAALHIVNEHGLHGFAEWTNHVWLRDFWTPHGVPFLPTGSASVYEWLIANGVAPSTASDILTINAVEVTAALLLARGSWTIGRQLNEFRRQQQFRAEWEKAVDLDRIPNNPAAAQALDQLQRAVDDSPNVLVGIALQHQFAVARTDDSIFQAERNERAYSIASFLLTHHPSSSDQVRVGDADVSAVGMAGYVLAGTLNLHVAQGGASHSQYDVARLKTAVRSFVKTASEAPKWKRVSRVVNRLMALELAIQLPKDPELQYEPTELRSDVLRDLERMRWDHEEVRVGPIIDGVRRAYPLSEDFGRVVPAH